MRKAIRYIVAAALIATPAIANAQAVSHGAERGAEAGSKALGVPGAVVGGVVGSVVGGVGALLGADRAPRFHDYVMTEHRPSYKWGDRVVVGAVLPSDGLEYWAVPDEYGVRDYRYTVVNDRVVLVDPRTHRIVQVIG